MSNPFQPKDIDEAIHKVNNNTSTSSNFENNSEDV